MNKFCFVIHPLSFEDIARYEPGAKGKGEAIIARSWSGCRRMRRCTSPASARPTDARPKAGSSRRRCCRNSSSNSRAKKSISRVVRAIEIGAELGAQVAGLGAFTAVVGDAGVTINERSPIPVTTGNSLTIAAGVQSLFRGAQRDGRSIRPAPRRS